MTSDDLAKTLLEDAHWNVAYHEVCLGKAIRKEKLVREFLSRGEFEVSDADADASDESEGEAEDCQTTEEFAVYLLGDAMGGVKYHQRQMDEAHKKVSATTALLIRAGYPVDTETALAAAYKRAREYE